MDDNDFQTLKHPLLHVLWVDELYLVLLGGMPNLNHLDQLLQVLGHQVVFRGLLKQLLYQVEHLVDQ